MKLPRRQVLLQLATAAAAVPMSSRMARAEIYPSRPVRLIATTAAGGMQDTIARLIGQRLSERLGQPFVIENRPGGGSNIGTEAVVKAPPDGYTLLLVGPPNATNATLYEKLKYDFIRDIAPVASISREPSIVVINPSVPVKTIPEFIAYAKANPGKINMASSGNGTGPHVAGELFKMMAGINMVHVPYRGGAPAVADLVGGQVQVMFIAMPAALPHIRARKLRALAVTTSMRSAVLPDMPTVGESVPGYEASVWFGVGAPRDTPAEIIGRLNKEINAAITDPKIRARFAALGGTVLPGSPAEFGMLISEETLKWGKVIRATNIRTH